MNPSWFELLVCPITKTPLRHDAVHHLLIAEAAGKAYPIRDGIPVLLAEEALDWSPELGAQAPISSKTTPI